MTLCFEDFAVGQTFESGPLAVDADMIRDFAGQFDPQPFHLDEAAAKDSFFGTLVASGWHTASLTMRLLVQTLPIAGGVVGAGAQVAWPKALAAGETIRLTVEVIELRASKSKPHLGFVKIRATTSDRTGPVQIMTADLVAPRTKT
jgi:acyl dehydratase